MAGDRRCANCGYDLLGLGKRGNCPECGLYFSDETGEGTISERDAARERSDRFAARLRTLLLLGAGAVVLAAGLGLSMIAVHPWRPIAISAVFAGIFGLAALTSYCYE